MKRKSTKKTKIQTSYKSKIKFFLVFTVLVILASLLILLFNLQIIDSIKTPQLQYVSKLKPHTVKAQSMAASPSAVLSPTAKPATTSASIPQNFGKSVTVPILMYHYIGNNPNPADKLRDNLSTTPDLFDKQMAYISQNGFNTISYDTLYAGLKGVAPLPPKSIILTFDDGYIDFYVNAYPILRRYGLHATSFIPTGLMDQGYYLHWSQIKEMDQTGLISFQAHSIHHANLPSLSYDAMVGEITTSKHVLEQELGKPVNFMAYPYGTSNASVWEAVKKVGYLGSAGTWFGTVESEGNIFDMPRIKIPGGLSVEEFAKRI